MSVILEDQEAASLHRSLSVPESEGQHIGEEEEGLEKRSLDQSLDDSSDSRPAQQQEPETPPSQLRLDAKDVQANPELTLEEPTPEAHSSSGLQRFE